MTLPALAESAQKSGEELAASLSSIRLVSPATSKTPPDVEYFLV
jgi:hypothetical protein